MNKRMTKRLRETLLTKPTETLLMIRNEYATKTEEIKNPETVWKKFKKMYMNGKVPKNFIVKQKKGK